MKLKKKKLCNNEYKMLALGGMYLHILWLYVYIFEICLRFHFIFHSLFQKVDFKDNKRTCNRSKMVCRMN